jgi:hypothetical protein
MLIDTLKQSKQFQEMPMNQQEIIAALAFYFEQTEEALYMTPRQLEETTKRGTREQWQAFLQLEPVKNFIKAEMHHQAQVAQRQTFLALQQAAKSGNVQAAKEINELSGIMSQQDNNKVVVLIRVNRPSQKEDQTKPKEETES